MMGRKTRLFLPLPAVSLGELVPADHFDRHLEAVQRQPEAHSIRTTQERNFCVSRRLANFR